MQLQKFHQLVNDEFGPQTGQWHLHSHVLSGYGKTPAQLMETEMSLREIWWALCKDFDIPKDRWLGEDY